MKTADEIFDLHKAESPTVGYNKPRQFAKLEDIRDFLLQGGIIPILWTESVSRLPMADQIWLATDSQLPPHRERKLKRVFTNALKEIGIS